MRPGKEQPEDARPIVTSQALRKATVSSCSGHMRREGRWTAVAILGLLAIPSAFNLAKAAHMDDGAHLAIPHAILRSPLHPMSALLNWDQVAEPIYRLNQPHLFFYLMAGGMALTHSSEFALHLLAAAFTSPTPFLFHVPA